MEAEGAALEHGDIDGAVAAIVAAWTQPHAPEALRERIASMQRRAFELQAAAGEVQEAPDPLEEHLEVLAELQIPALLAAGEDDMADFRDAAEQLAEVLPLALACRDQGRWSPRSARSPRRVQTTVTGLPAQQDDPIGQLRVSVPADCR